ncbi:MAG: hypothetical protein ACFE0J_21570 [Elainellaceae cyanobacterium]
MQSNPLFIDLSPEQSALIEGGYIFHLHSIKAIKAGADRDGVDEAYLAFFPSMGRVNKIWERSMKTGDVARINQRVPISRVGRTSLALFDADTCSSDDLIGVVSKPRPAPIPLLLGRGTIRLSGSGSTYDLTYSITA